MSEITDVTTKEDVAKVANENPPLKVNEVRFSPVFPTLIGEVLLDLPVEDMVSDVIKISSDTRNYEGGFTTFFDRKNLDEVRGMKELKEAIGGIAATFGREHKYEMNYDRCAIDVWVNVMNKAGVHSTHNHKNTYFSGAFYARIDDEMSPLLLRNPTHVWRSKEAAINPKDLTAFTSEWMVIQPKPNMLYIWPSWMEHRVPQMDQDKPMAGPRISFNFNVDYLPLGV